MDGNATVSFDLLKSWALDAFGREIGETTTLGCGWASLADALRHAGVLGEASEQELRQNVVHQYCHLNPITLDIVLEAKRCDRLSFFNLIGCELEEARSYWTWYLYCLTFLVGDVNEHVGNHVACIPLDTIDLMIVARALRVQITVSRLVEESLRFWPPDDVKVVASVHLILRQADKVALWAPLLQLRQPSTEPLSLIGAVVELVRLPAGPLEVVSGRTAVIQSYDVKNMCYEACVDGVCFPVFRNQISRIVLHANSITDEQCGLESSGAAEDRPGTADAWSQWLTTGAIVTFGDPIAGIPDCAIEFQALHELVRRDASARLQQAGKELSGRDSAPANFNAPSPSLARTLAGVVPVSSPSAGVGATNQCATAVTVASRQAEVETGTRTQQGLLMVTLQEIVNLLSDRAQVCIVAPRAVSMEQGEYLSFAAGDELRLRSCHQERGLVYGQSTLTGVWGWIMLKNVTVWSVHTKCEQHDEYLALEVGQKVVLQHSYEGDHLGIGYAYLETDPTKEGYVRTDLLHERFTVKR